MKTILYSLISICFFTSCEKDEVQDIDPPVADARTYNYDIVIDVDDTFGAYTITGETAMFKTGAYGIDDWDGYISFFQCSSVWDASLGYHMNIEIDKDFTFNFENEWTNNSIDSIYGSGYFDADTLYMTYDYVGQDGTSGAHGQIHIHSL